MKKVTIQVEETVRYENEIVVIQPDGMTDDDFDNVLGKAERENAVFHGGVYDLAMILERDGIEVLPQSFNFPGNPLTSELEIVDVREED